MRRTTTSLTAAMVGFALLATIPTPAGASLDPTYGSGGIAAIPLSAATGDRFLAAAAGPAGTTYAAGYVTTTGTDQAMAVARIRADGSPDPSFDGDGVATVNVAPGRGAAETARGIGAQSTGRVVVGGPAESTDAGAHERDVDIYVTRLTAAGGLDATFGSGGVTRLNLSPGAVTNPTSGAYGTDTSYGLLVLPNDKLFITAARGPGGTAGRLDGDFAFIQLTADGALDPSFGTGGITFLNTTATVNGASENLNDTPRQAVVQPDGKIVVGAYATGTPGAILRLIRLQPNGDLDPTFGNGGIATAPVLGPASTVAEVYNVGMQGDDFIVTGYGRTGATGTVDLYVSRFKANGTWDTTYGDGGTTRVDLAGEDDRARTLVVLADGRALVAGSGKLTGSNIDAMAVMFTAQGQLDTGFDGDGIALIDLGGPADSFFGVARSSGETAVLAGYRGASPSSGDDAVVARLSTARTARAGYRLAAADGGVFAFGDATFVGSMGGQRLNSPIVGLASTPSAKGYWLAAADGGVFAFGDAAFLGSMGGQRLNSPIVAVAATRSGRGYRLVAADGGVFAFGDAAFLGSMGGQRLNSPIVGAASMPSGQGYWLAAADGGVFAFGDARFVGSAGATRLNRPVVAVSATPTGEGYRLVANDGGVFAFGDASFRGSAGAQRVNSPIIGLATTSSGRGYWLAAADGGVFAFGDAAFVGGAAARPLRQPVRAIVAG